jgi:hypothetical protein
MGVWSLKPGRGGMLRILFCMRARDAFRCGRVTDMAGVYGVDQREARLEFCAKCFSSREYTFFLFTCEVERGKASQPLGEIYACICPCLSTLVACYSCHVVLLSHYSCIALLLGWDILLLCLYPPSRPLEGNPLEGSLLETKTKKKTKTKTFLAE